MQTQGVRIPLMLINPGITYFIVFICYYIVNIVVFE